MLFRSLISPIDMAWRCVACSTTVEEGVGTVLVRLAVNAALNAFSIVSPSRSLPFSANHRYQPRAGWAGTRRSTTPTCAAPRPPWPQSTARGLASTASASWTLRLSFGSHTWPPSRQAPHALALPLPSPLILILSHDFLNSGHVIPCPRPLRCSLLSPGCQTGRAGREGRRAA